MQITTNSFYPLVFRVYIIFSGCNNVWRNSKEITFHEMFALQS